MCRYFLILLATLLFSGCTYIRATMNLDERLIQESYVAVDMLLNAMSPPLIPRQKILVTSFVNVSNLEESSSLGRIISEQYAARLSQHDLGPIEVRLRKSLAIKDAGGEFMLSRDARQLGTMHDAAVVVVGTYSVAQYAVYVAAKIISVDTGIIAASYDYVLPLNENVRAMLSKKQEPRRDRW